MPEFAALGLSFDDVTATLNDPRFLTGVVPSANIMGFMLENRVWSLYGPHTEHAFGHLGFSNVLGWADPARGLSGALLTSGKAVVGPHLLPLWQVMRRIASVTPRDRLDTSPNA